MGLIPSKQEKIALARSKEIDKYLLQSLNEHRCAKLVLCGTNESGKRTFYNHVKIIYGNGFSSKELDSYKPSIYSNAIQSLVSILRAMPNLDIKFDSSDSNEQESKAMMIFDVIQNFKESDPFTPEVLKAMKELWANSRVQECFLRSNEYELNCSTKYFLDDLDRLNQEGYRPNESDILRLRVYTSGVHTEVFSNQVTQFRLSMVGGCITERKKWIHAFEDVSAVIFVAALSDYDLHEDDVSNRLQESLKLFDSICNNPWFGNTMIILFLNKKDVFKEKIKKSSLSICFPEYTMPCDRIGSEYEDGVNYITKKFLDKTKLYYKRKRISTFTTSAIDEEDVKSVFDEVTHLIQKEKQGSCNRQCFNRR